MPLTPDFSLAALTLLDAYNLEIEPLVLRTTAHGEFGRVSRRTYLAHRAWSRSLAQYGIQPNDTLHLLVMDEDKPGRLGSRVHPLEDA